MTSKRVRKVINYAALAGSEMSDDDDFDGFSPPVSASSNTPSSACHRSSSGGGKLSKRRTSTHQQPSSAAVTDSEDASISDDEDNCDRHPQQPARRGGGRPSLQEKIFQRDLEAALQLSKKVSGGTTHEEEEEDKENHQRSDTSALTTHTVPVEVHGNRVCSYKKQLQAFPLPRRLVDVRLNTEAKVVSNNGGGVVEMLDDITTVVVGGEQTDQDLSVGTAEITGSAVLSVDGECSSSGEVDVRNCLIEDSDAGTDASEGVVIPTRTAKRKSCVIESDDEFESANEESVKKIKDKRLNSKQSKGSKTDDIVESKNILTTSGEESSKSLKTDENIPKVLDKVSSLESNMAGKRGVRAVRRAVSFKQDSDTDTEDEWDEKEDLDEDNLSEAVSEGSDFEPSPKKKKKTPSKKTNTKKTTMSSAKKTPPPTTARSSRSCAAGSRTDCVTSPEYTVIVESNAGSSLPLPQTVAKPGRVPLNSRCNPKVNTAAASPVGTPALSSNGNLSSLASNCNLSSLPKKSNVSSVPISGITTPRAISARNSFKSPLIASAGSAATLLNGTTLTSSSTSGGMLRLGLSRKANYKPLHPNASVK